MKELITKELIEENIGYEISDYSVEEVIVGGIITGFNIKVIPLKSFEEIIVDFKIEKPSTS